MVRNAELAHTTAMPGVKQTVKLRDDSTAGRRHQIMWIDGVGGYLLCQQDEVMIGHATSVPTADLLIMGDLSRQAIAIRRTGSDYLLQPYQETQIDGTRTHRPQLLRHGQTIAVGSSVRLKFSKPSPLSSTARLDLVSHHRWKPAVDGVLLLADSCIFGPRSPSQVPCPHWQCELLLYKVNGQWCFRTAAETQVNGRTAESPFPLVPGMRASSEDFSFSIEANN